MLRTTRIREGGVCVPFWSTQEAGLALVDPKTHFLLHFNGAHNSTVFADSSMYKHSFTATGSPIISTTQSKFGGSAGYFNGSSYLSNTDIDWAIGLQDFTMECWVYPVDKTIRIFADTHSSENSGGAFLATFSNGFSCKVGSVDYNKYDFSTNKWYHIALSRQSTTTYFFIDGVLKESRSNSDNFTSNIITIGRRSTENRFYFSGYIDEFRLSVGVARYTGNFTPQDMPFAR